MSALSLTLMILPPIQKLSTSWIEAFLHAHQILFPVVPLSFSDDFMITLLFFSILV